MRKFLFGLVLIGTWALIIGCATLPKALYEAALNIHDVFFTAEEPESYDDCVKLDQTSFNYGDTFYLVVRFGGLQLDEGNVVRWGAAAEVTHNTVYAGQIGPVYFNGDLDDPGTERDKYLSKVKLVMDDVLPPGLYEFTIYVIDGLTYEMVETYISLSLLPRDINIMQKWDELFGYGPENPLFWLDL